MPGLFKHECEGSQMIAVFSKCDYNDEQDSESKKFSKMGVSKRDILISLFLICWKNRLHYSHHYSYPPHCSQHCRNQVLTTRGEWGSYKVADRLDNLFFEVNSKHV